VGVAPSFSPGVGIEPTTVEQFPDIPDQLECDARDLFRDEVAPLVPANAPPSSLGPAELVRQRLRDLHRSVGGTSEVRYGAATILKCLRFASNLKPSAMLHSALADASDLLLGDDGADLSTEIRKEAFRLPALDTLRMARIKLDIVGIMHERQLAV